MKRGHRLYANDQLELLSMKATNQPFPEHFHETFCISLINEGVEVIELAHQTLHVSSGTISITNPYEIHANPILAAGTSLSFDTLYLSQEEADRILTQQGVRFANLQPSHPEQTNLFAKVKAQLTQPTAASLHSVLHPFLSSLLQVPPDHVPTEPSPKWQELIQFLQASFSEKISLEQMAGMMEMNKFEFAKEFRAHIGMSPGNYFLMRKVFAAKQAIQPATNLTELAYEFGFADQAHFSRTFKRFIGVSPRKVKQAQNDFGTTGNG